MLTREKIERLKALVARTASLYETGTCNHCDHPWAEHYRKCEEGSLEPDSSGCQHDGCGCFYIPPISRYEEKERVESAMRDLQWEGREAVPALLAEREELIGLRRGVLSGM